MNTYRQLAIDYEMLFSEQLRRGEVIVIDPDTVMNESKQVKSQNEDGGEIKERTIIKIANAECIKEKIGEFLNRQAAKKTEEI